MTDHVSADRLARIERQLSDYKQALSYEHTTQYGDPVPDRAAGAEDVQWMVEEIKRLRRNQPLSLAQAFKLVLELAYENTTYDPEHEAERKRQLEAIGLVTHFAHEYLGEDAF